MKVEQLPAEVNAGKDPQLEKAIAIVLRELEKNPPRNKHVSRYDHRDQHRTRNLGVGQLLCLETGEE